MDRATRVGARGDVDDARGRGLLEEVEQEVRQQKSGEVVDLERPLKAVRRDLAMRRVDAGVIDENIEPRILPLEFLREGPRGVFARQINDLEVDLRVSGVSDDVLTRGLASRRTATRHDDRPAQAGEAQRRGFADP